MKNPIRTEAEAFSFVLVVAALAVAVAVAMRLIFPIWFKVPLLTGPLEALIGLY